MVAKTEQRAIDLHKRVEEAERAVAEGLGVVRRKMVAEMDEVIVRYNENLFMFRDHSWYEKGHASALAVAWEKVLEDKIRDLKLKELDEVALENEVLRDFDIEILHEWKSLRPKTITMASEASSSFLTKNIKTNTSTPAAATHIVPGYNSDEPHIPVITSKGGMSLVSPVFEKAQISPTAVANLFLLLSHVAGQPAIVLLPMPARVLLEPQRSQSLFPHQLLLRLCMLLRPFGLGRRG